MMEKEKVLKILKERGFEEAPDFETFLLIAPNSLLGLEANTDWGKKFNDLHDKSVDHLFKQTKKREGTEVTSEDLDNLIVHCDL